MHLRTPPTACARSDLLASCSKRLEVCATRKRMLYRCRTRASQGSVGLLKPDGRLQKHGELSPAPPAAQRTVPQKPIHGGKHDLLGAHRAVPLSNKTPKRAQNLRRCGCSRQPPSPRGPPPPRLPCTYQAQARRGQGARHRQQAYNVVSRAVAWRVTGQAGTLRAGTRAATEASKARDPNPDAARVTGPGAAAAWTGAARAARAGSCTRLPRGP